MARWRLVAPHYLNVEGTTWEYKEVDRNNGRQKRVTFPVPLLLDPREPGDWNYRNGADEGEIIVSNGTNPQPRDIIFTGDPTPDMVPVDDEAQAISATFAGRWKHPIETLSGTYADAMLDTFQEEIAKVRSAAAPPTEGMTELLAAMTAMMKQNGELIAALAVKPEPSAGLRRA